MIDARWFNGIDGLVFVTANLMNLLLAIMFLLRGRGKPAAGRIVGWVAVGLALPLGVAAMLNGMAERGWPFWVLPGLTVSYCFLELILDGVLKLDFRHNRLLGPYLLVYYVGLMAMIGYAFLMGRLFGYITLVTYFINLGTTAYSYRRVGHS